MTPRLTAALAATLFVGFALPVRAQEEGQRRVLAVNVIGQDGNQVPGLAAANFRGEFRGQPVKILSAVLDTSPRRIAVVVDTSASMKERGDAWAFAWSAAQDLVLSFTPAHRVAILTLGEKLQQHSDLSTDQRALQQALLDARAHEPAGPSSLYDGVSLASQAFSRLPRKGLGDVVFLISDGEDTSSSLSSSEAEIGATRAGVRVFVVFIRPPALQRPLRWSLGENWMRSIAEATGGFVFQPERYKRDEGVKQLQPFYPLITHVYRLEVAFPQVVDKLRKWNLEGIDANGKKLKSVQLAYPRLLVPSLDK